ncbi:MAG: AmmeMemoRadiSam system protein A [Desulfovibrio sp.]|jgi:AmmeMemoRadiSam system protein A|nr:AmmeMemoRadiSam system protein A [Desulfovibrio sp.]
MPFIWAALMPHPPVLVHEVGKGREREASRTLEGMERLRAALTDINTAQAPDVLLVLSPHQPHVPGALFINVAPAMRGSLARFGAPEVKVALRGSEAALGELTTALKAGDIPCAGGDMPDITQDHGAVVPLHFILPTFPEGKVPPVLLAGPSGLSLDHALALGDVLRALPGERRWALLAGGDLSHRLKSDGPYGFDPAGPLFDAAVVEAVKLGDPVPLLKLGPEKIAAAGECGLRSVLTLLRFTRAPLKLFSYEGPFGVGYCNALWANRDLPARGLTPDGPRLAGKPRISVRVLPSVSPARTAPSAPKGGHPYPRLARAAIAALLGGRPAPNAADAKALAPQQELWTPRKGCFVSIKNRDGSLRGCIGTFLPVKDGLAAEITANAASAATRDPRFPPMRPEELPGVRISVDVLSEPELVRPGMKLNPKVYGVIVVKGGRRGLLLPDLEGVDSVERQLAVAAQKGGILDPKGAEIYRFTVDRYYEDGAGPTA